VTLVVGRRTADSACEAFLDFYTRMDGQLPELITTDEYAPYFSVIVSVYGVRKEELELTEAEKEALGWEQMPPLYFPVEIAYATVHKERAKGRVVRVEPQILLGTPAQVAETLSQGTTARTIHTSYVERWHGTNRHFNARKARKVYTFSKDLALCRRDLVGGGVLQLRLEAAPAPGAVPSRPAALPQPHARHGGRTGDGAVVPASHPRLPDLSARKLLNIP
jgi:hypothetical protein